MAAKHTWTGDSKPCTRCNEVGVFQTSPYGTQCSVCNGCVNTLNKIRRREKAEKLAQIKMEQGCTDCGYNTHHSALHFDHLPGTVKLYNVALMLGHKWETIYAEIAKCEVVCANCHAVRTSERRGALKPL